jgi:DNA-binding SARP family transcriptional activator
VNPWAAAKSSSVFDRERKTINEEEFRIMDRARPSLAKIDRPRVMGIYPRTNLFDLLDKGRERPLVWISGPPGCGKTTLTTSYLDTRKVPSLWYQIDERDEDPATFFYFLGQAAKRAAPAKRKPLPLLTPQYLRNITAFTLHYFEDLYSRLKTPCIMVFDNYQDLPPTSPLHEIIALGLSIVPDGKNVILISRSGPSPGFSRLLANNLVTVLGWNELRLTLDESMGIARSRALRDLSDEEIQLLHNTADGWAAGLVLMLESARGKRVESPVAARPTPEEIIDYFGNELFNRLDEQMRQFLLNTSFLHKMTVKMAEEITGHENAKNILSTFSRNNYFTETHFERDCVYQYHPLFREFLTFRAREIFSPETISELIHRSALLLADAGEVHAAMELLREGKNWDTMGRLILKHAESMLAQGRIGQLHHWLEMIPWDIVENIPWLLFWTGACHFLIDPKLAYPFFKGAYEKFKVKGDPSGLYLTWAGTVDSIVFSLEDLRPLDKWIAAFKELNSRIPMPPSRHIESRVASSMLGALSLRQPEHPDTELWAERALSIPEDPQSAGLKARTLLNLVYYRIVMGDHKKIELEINALKHLRRSRHTSPVVNAISVVADAIWFQVAGLHEQCLKAASEGIELSQASGDRLFVPIVMLHAASSALNRNDCDAAWHFLERMISSSKDFNPRRKSMYHCVHARYTLIRGDLGGALFHSDLALKLSIDLGMLGPLLWSYLTRAMVLHEVGRHREAREHLDYIFDTVKRTGSKYFLFLALMAEALFALDQGEDASGLTSLGKALAIGKEQGYLNTFVDRPDGTARLCAKALEAGMEVAYVQEIIKKRRLTPEKLPVTPENWPWQVKIYTLGRFLVLSNDAPLRYSGKAQVKPMEMLKVLIALGSRNVRVEKISDILWPEAEGDAARSAFSTTLLRLRRLVGDEKAIVYQDGRLAIDDRRCWLDFRSFEGMLSEAEAAWKENAPEKAIGLTGKALGLYKGAFLDGDDSDWALSLRENLRSGFLMAAMKVGLFREEEGQLEQAAECYRRGLLVDDLAEEFYQRLMSCYLKLGRKAEALAVYERCRLILERTFGVEPSPETRALRIRVKAS